MWHTHLVGEIARKVFQSFPFTEPNGGLGQYWTLLSVGKSAVPIASVWPTGQPRMRLVCTSPMPYDTYEVRQQRYSN